MLLKNGADINASNNEGNTALHIASTTGYEEVVRLILDYRAVPNSPAELGCTPSIGATSLGRSPPAEVPHEHGVETACHDYETRRSLRRTANSGNAEISRISLSHRASVSQPNKHGETALYMAAESGHLTIVNALLDAGADVSLASSYGYTVLHVAARYGHLTTVNALLDVGADVSQTTKHGSTALHEAAESGRLTTVNALLEAGADVSQTNEDGDTALHEAASKGHLTSVNSLLDAGADVSQTDEDGDTALHVAASEGHLTSVKVLLNAGADVNQRNHMAQTALCLSIKERHAEVAKVLIEAGADPSILDYFGRNCFDWIASLRLDVPLLQATSPKTKDPLTVMDMYHQGILYALRKPSRFCDTKAMEISQEASIEYDLLGRLLLLQNRRQDACPAFERQIQVARETGIHCDLCDMTLPKEGVVDGTYYVRVYFVCTTCTDIDLCSSCMEQYGTTGTIDREGVEFCENHEFLKVPSDGWQDVPEGKVNKQGETEDEWLARLATIDGEES